MSLINDTKLCQKKLNNDAKNVSLKISHLLFLTIHFTFILSLFILNDTIF